MFIVYRMLLCSVVEMLMILILCGHSHLLACSVIYKHHSCRPITYVQYLAIACALESIPISY